jgi:hypothetical protein
MEGVFLFNAQNGKHAKVSKPGTTGLKFQFLLNCKEHK